MKFNILSTLLMAIVAADSHETTSSTPSCSGTIKDISLNKNKEDYVFTDDNTHKINLNSNNFFHNSNTRSCPVK